jgi:hypothetical protein
MYKKGQSAMEYLMTYGWAILVIVIVLAILAFYLPKLTKAPESCLFTKTDEFDCNEVKAAIYAETGSNNVRVAFNLQNRMKQSVKLTRILCTTAPLAEVKASDAELISSLAVAANYTVPAGGSRQYTVSCKDKTGKQITSQPNAEFKGLLVVWYNYENEVSAPVERQSEAVLTGTVLQQK